MNIVTDLRNSFNPYPKTKVEKKKQTTKIKQKSSKLAKKERNRFSILQKDNTKCFVCGRQIKLDKHEAFGGSNRHLCRKCHQKADTDEITIDYLHDFARQKFIKKYDKEKFLKEFGKNYKK